MKIGILSEIINYHSGARAPLLIAKELAIRGHSITIFAYDTHIDLLAKNDLEKENISIILYSKNKFPIIGKYITAISLFKDLKKNPVEAMWYSGTLPFFLAAYCTGIPIIRMYQGTQFDAYLENKNPNEKINLVERLLNKLANIYIYLNDFIAFSLSNCVVAISKFSALEGEILYRKKVNKVIYHGTSLLSFSDKATNPPRKNITIISVSRITPYKGFHLIIEAINKIKDIDINLVIAGSQPKKKYVSYLKKLGREKVKIVLNPTDQELSKLYKKSNFCITADRYLYFGLSIYEAAFHKIPTIAFNFAAASEIIVHGKTGFVAKSKQEFIDYITLLAKDIPLQNKLGENAYKRAMQYSWKKCAKEWEKVIDSVIYESKQENLQ